NVDVAAHISGFLCGVVCGGLGACVQRWFVPLQRWSVLVGGLALLLIGVAWWAAVTS
ncbi:MAG: membrane associated rhomboid family serine protease, partial [Lentimonas sp.]